MVMEVPSGWAGSVKGQALRGVWVSAGKLHIRLRLVQTLLTAGPLCSLALVVVTIAGHAVAQRAERDAVLVVAALQAGQGLVVALGMHEPDGAQSMQILVNISEHALMPFPGVAEHFTDGEFGEAQAQVLEARDGQQVIIAVGGGERAADRPEGEETIIHDVEGLGFVAEVMLAVRSRSLFWILEYYWDYGQAGSTLSSIRRQPEDRGKWRSGSAPGRPVCHTGSLPCQLPGPGRRAQRQARSRPGPGGGSACASGMRSAGSRWRWRHPGRADPRGTWNGWEPVHRPSDPTAGCFGRPGASFRGVFWQAIRKVEAHGRSFSWKPSAWRYPWPRSAWQSSFARLAQSHLR